MPLLKFPVDLVDFEKSQRPDFRRSAPCYCYQVVYFDYFEIANRGNEKMSRDFGELRKNPRFANFEKYHFAVDD